MTRVLFVCLGNICRSPTAEGVFTRLIKDEGLEEFFHIDSAGTHAYHVGQPPDERAQAAARKRGIELGRLKGRQVAPEDVQEFDYVLAMDFENLDNLIKICPKGYEYKVSLFLSHAPDLEVEEVPDPYYGGKSGFDYVLDITEEAAKGLLKKIRKEKGI
jgi:protein-tyrosine phosphatase